MTVHKPGKHKKAMTWDRIVIGSVALVTFVAIQFVWQVVKVLI